MSSFFEMKFKRKKFQQSFVQCRNKKTISGHKQESEIWNHLELGTKKFIGSNFVPNQNRLYS